MILYLVLINLGCFIALVVITTIGHEYDKAYKLYPETVQLSYDLSISGIYGERWIRFFKAALLVGGILDLVLIFMWYRKRPAKAIGLEL